MTKELKIMFGIAIVVIAGAVLLFLKGNPPAHVPLADAGRLVRDDSDMTGSKDAKVTLVEFGDYECPFCGALNPVIEKLLADYKDNKDFNYVFRNFPLAQHQYAKLAAEAAEAAGAQGKFWDMHNKIFDNQNSWTGNSQPLDIFTSFAQILGLDINKFKDAVQNNQAQDKITEDLDDGNALGVNATPTLYLNGKQESATDYDNLKKDIDAALKQ
ncbi:MAG: thioredoxin domain-containing protein [Candidatus Doudnabacteria bacterium]